MAATSFTSAGDRMRAERLQVAMADISRHGWPETDKQWREHVKRVDKEMNKKEEVKRDAFVA